MSYHTFKFLLIEVLSPGNMTHPHITHTEYMRKTSVMFNNNFLNTTKKRITEEKIK